MPAFKGIMQNIAKSHSEFLNVYILILTIFYSNFRLLKKIILIKKITKIKKI